LISDDMMSLELTTRPKLASPRWLFAWVRPIAGSPRYFGLPMVSLDVKSHAPTTGLLANLFGQFRGFVAPQPKEVRFSYGGLIDIMALE
jgi:hypothetical protein